MTETPSTPQSVYRVFADDKGDVYLVIEPSDFRIPVDRPVSFETLAKAKKRAAELAISSASPTEAQAEIELALYPLQRGPLLSRLKHASGQITFHLFAALIYLGLIVGVYKGIQHSSENWPEWVHRIVIFVSLCIIAGLLYVIFTEKNRLKYQQFVLEYFGIYGMFVLPCLLLIASGAVLASITFRLYNAGSLALEMCSERAVSEAGLLDFYMWHFVNVIPTLEITKLWRWDAPYCYTQTRVGFLIFAFHLLVVIPSLNTIRFFWKHRNLPVYAYDRDWMPSQLQKPRIFEDE